MNVRARHQPGAVVAGAFVVLHPDEVVVARQLQPARVHRISLLIPDLRRIADRLIVDDRTLSPTGRSGRRALIAARPATCPAAMPSSSASNSSGSATLASR